MRNHLSDLLFMHQQLSFYSHNSKAIRFISLHCSAVSFLFSLWCSQGESISSLPCAQASNCSPCGFDNGVKPFSNSTIVGSPALKASRITLFSPGEMAGDTRTVPFLAASRYLCTSLSKSQPTIRRDTRTNIRWGAVRSSRLPMPLYCWSPFLKLKNGRNQSGRARFIINRRGLSRR